MDLNEELRRENTKSCTFGITWIKDNIKSSGVMSWVQVHLDVTSWRRLNQTGLTLWTTLYMLQTVSQSGCARVK